MLSEQQKKNYIDIRGSSCPYCGSTSIEGTGVTDFDASYAWNEIRCLDCNKTWEDRYIFQGITEKEEPVKPAIPIYNKEGEASVKPGLYLGLFHGFHSEEERSNANAWGADGPLIGPLEQVLTTYMCNIRIFFSSLEDAKLYGFDDVEVFLHVDKEDCIVFGDMQYGDWAVLNLPRKSI